MIRRRVMTALALLIPGLPLGCAGVEALTSSTTGDLVVAIVMGGNGSDPDGFTVSIDSKSIPATSASPVTFSSVAPGLREVRLGGLADHCFADRESISKAVVAGVSATVEFRVYCVGGIAYHEVVSAGNYQIRYLGENGRVVSLTNAPGRNFVREWSPDGSRILFSTDASGTDHLFTMRPDGSDLRQLTSGTSTDIRPRWAPDGTRIAFWRYDPSVVGGTSWIVIMNADGSNQHALIDVRGFESDPVWSADGTKLYFSCSRFPTNSTLCVAASDGTGLRGIVFPELTALDCTNCFLPTPQHWDLSPDGRFIAFETNISPNKGGQAVWVGDVNGSSAKLVTPGTVSFAGRWSPHGDAVLVNLADSQNGYALATAKPDGSGFKVLTSFPDKDQSGEFSPDETLIAFGGFRTGDQRIYTMNADGSVRHQLAPEAGTKFVPRWNPNARPRGPFVAGAPSSVVSVPAATMLPSTSRPSGEPLMSIGECSVVRRGSSSRVICSP